MTYKRLLAAALAAFMLFLCAGCGGVVDTVLTVDTAFAGSRVMTVTVPADDLEKVTGGSELLDRVAAENCPSTLAYAGEIPEEGGYRQTFTLTFTDREDYLAKVRELLNANLAEGEEAAEPTLTFETENSLFKKGVRIEESFTSVDLLAWYRVALRESGAISESESNWYEFGDNTLTVNGETYNSDSGRLMSVDEQERRCLDDCTVETDMNTDGSFVRRIALEADNDLVKTLQAEGTDLQAYLEALNPADGTFTVEEGSYETVYRYEFPAADVAQLVEKTNAILKTDQNSFEVTVALNPDEAGMAEVTVEECLDASFYLDSGRTLRSQLKPYANCTAKDGQSYIESSGYSVQWVKSGMAATYAYDWQISFAEVALKVSPSGLKKLTVELNMTLPEGLSAEMKQAALDGVKAHAEEADDAVSFEETADGCTVSASGTLSEVQKALNRFGGRDGSCVIYQQTFRTKSRLTGGMATSLTFDFSSVIGQTDITVANTDGFWTKQYYAAPLTAGTESGTLTLDSYDSVTVYTVSVSLGALVALAALVLVFAAAVVTVLVRRRDFGALIGEARQVAAAKKAAKATAAAVAVIPAAPVSPAVPTVAEFPADEGAPTVVDETATVAPVPPAPPISPAPPVPPAAPAAPDNTDEEALL